MNLSINTSEPFVSIVTPVYNGEKYIKECIESVLNQTYENWEYIIVNNCSTDQTRKIAESYVEEDPRIRIHNNSEFLDQMVNWNHALQQLSNESKYCKVLHADDLLFPECISKMVDLSEKYPSVGLVSSYQIDGKKIRPDGSLFPKSFISGKQICRRYFLNDDYHCVAPPSALLIRSDLILKRGKFYDETFLQADTGACLDVLRESDFGFVHQVLTYTRKHSESVSNTSISSYMHSLGILKIYLEYAPIFLSNNEVKQVTNKRERIFYIQFSRSMIQGNFLKIYEEVKNEIDMIDQNLKKGKLMLYLCREFILHNMRRMGILK